MINGTFNSALRAVLPHAGDAKAARQDRSWLYVTPGEVLATDRYTMARAFFTDQGGITETVRVDAPTASRLLNLTKAVITTQSNTLVATTPDIEIRFPDFDDTEYQLLSEMKRVLDQYRDKDATADPTAYMSRYLARFSERYVGLTPVRLFPHGPSKPTMVRVGGTFEAAIMPCRVS